MRPAVSRVDATAKKHPRREPKASSGASFDA
jgi:hypothetical protein